MMANKSPHLDRLQKSGPCDGIVTQNGWTVFINGTGLYLWKSLSRERFFHHPIEDESSGSCRRMVIEFDERASRVRSIFYMTSTGRLFHLKPSSNKSFHGAEIEGLVKLEDSEYITMLTSSGDYFVTGSTSNRITVLKKEMVDGAPRLQPAYQADEGWSTALYGAANWMMKKMLTQDAITGGQFAFHSHSSHHHHQQQHHAPLGLYVTTKSAVARYNVSSKADLVWEDKMPSLLNLVRKRRIDIQYLEFLDVVVGKHGDKVFLVGGVSAETVLYLLVHCKELKNGLQGKSYAEITEVRAKEAAANIPKLQLEERSGTLITAACSRTWYAIYEEKGKGFQKLRGQENMTDEEEILGSGFHEKSNALSLLLLRKGGSITTLLCSRAGATKRGGGGGGGGALRRKGSDEKKYEKRGLLAAGERPKNTSEFLLSALMEYRHRGDLSSQHLEEMERRQDLEDKLKEISRSIINQMPSTNRPLLYDSSLTREILSEKTEYHRHLISMAEQLRVSAKCRRRLRDDFDTLLAAGAFSDEVAKMASKKSSSSVTKNTRDRFSREALTYKYMKKAVEKEKLEYKGLTIPEIFFSHVTCLHQYIEAIGDYSGLLLREKQETKKLVQVLQDLLGWRRELSNLRKKEWGKKKDVPDYVPWTHNGSESIKKILLSCAQLAGRKGGCNVEIFNTAKILAEIRLEDLHYLENRARRNANGKHQKHFAMEYSKCRRNAIKLMKDVGGHEGEIKAFAEMYKDFDYIVDYCERSSSKEEADMKLVAYGKKFRKDIEELIKTVIKYVQMRKENPTERLLELASLEGFEKIPAYLSSKEYAIHWLLAMRNKDYTKAARLLRDHALKEEKSVKKCLHLLSILRLINLQLGKVTIHKDMNEVNAHLSMAKAHILLGKETYTGFKNVDKIFEALLPEKHQNAKSRPSNDVKAGGGMEVDSEEEQQQQQKKRCAIVVKILSSYYLKESIHESLLKKSFERVISNSLESISKKEKATEYSTDIISPVKDLLEYTMVGHFLQAIVTDDSGCGVLNLGILKEHAAKVKGLSGKGVQLVRNLVDFARQEVPIFKGRRETDIWKASNKAMCFVRLEGDWKTGRIWVADIANGSDMKKDTGRQAVIVSAPHYKRFKSIDVHEFKITPGPDWIDGKATATINFYYVRLADIKEGRGLERPNYRLKVHGG